MNSVPSWGMMPARSAVISQPGHRTDQDAGRQARPLDQTDGERNDRRNDCHAQPQADAEREPGHAQPQADAEREPGTHPHKDVLVHAGDRVAERYHND